MKVDPVYLPIIENLKKFSDNNKQISIARARYVLSRIHRLSQPYTTTISAKMVKIGILKTNGARGLLDIDKNYSELECIDKKLNSIKSDMKESIDKIKKLEQELKVLESRTDTIQLEL